MNTADEEIWGQHLLDANPKDRNNQLLIWADWLEDRGDPAARGARAMAQLNNYFVHYFRIPQTEQTLLIAAIFLLESPTPASFVFHANLDTAEITYRAFHWMAQLMDASDLCDLHFDAPRHKRKTRVPYYSKEDVPAAIEQTMRRYFRLFD